MELITTLQGVLQMSPLTVRNSLTSLNPNELRLAFIQKLQEEGLTGFDSELISENLLSPAQIILPRTVYEKIQRFIGSVFKIRESENYIKYFKPELDSKGLRDPGNKSILMSYDFHLSSHGDPKLIETNTNASFLALGKVMYDVHEEFIPRGVHRLDHFTWERIASDIQKEWTLWGIDRALKKIKIVDEAPSAQRLYLEFLLYKKVLEQFGWDVQIEDISDFRPDDADFIYNRWTDFYLDSPVSNTMKKAFIEKKCCISPNPFEYFLLADKQRMIDWASPQFLESLTDLQQKIWQENVSPFLLNVEKMVRENADVLWSKRKNLFFKPQASFGSKQAFKGASISRSAFEQFFNSPSIAQELSPAPEVEFLVSGKVEKFKFDLRCYAYQGELELILARIYQGQTTNLKTAYGGFAPVYFSN